MSIEYPGRGALLTIIRGLPGSGKSTKAIELYKKGSGLLIEPDAGLYIDGVYTYTPERMERVQNILSSAFRFSASCKRKMLRDGQSDLVNIPIIYADCLCLLEDVFALIYCSGLLLTPERVRVIDCEIPAEVSYCRNVHNVSWEDIDAMNDDWMPWEYVQENGYKYKGVTIPPHSFIE